MEDNFIVLIDFGNTEITGIIAQKKEDGFNVIGTEKEPSENLIKNGVLTGSTTDLANKVKRITTLLGNRLTKINNQFNIQCVYACVNDYSISNITSGESEKIGSNMYIKKSSVEKIRKVFNTANINLQGIEPSPIGVANCVPVDAKSKNCAIIDFGADTTSVCIYQNKILKSIATYPLGGKNITIDIQNVFNLKFDEAEKIKLEYGNAIADDASNLKDISATTRENENITISTKELAEITEARIREIWDNFVWKDVTDWSLENELDGGIFVTGNAFKLNGLRKHIRKATKLEPEEIACKDFPKASIRGIVAQAATNCVILKEKNIEEDKPKKSKESQEKWLDKISNLFDKN